MTSTEDSTTTATNNPPTNTTTTNTTGNGSRESSEFEFVERNNKTAASATVTTSSLPPPSALPSFPDNPPVVVANPPSKSVSVPVGMAEKVSSNKEAALDGDDEEEESLFGWVKASGSGFLKSVAEKTKTSVESVITTLDPQMKDYIYSGGFSDVEILVASDKESKVNPIKDGFTRIFGSSTTVYGVPSQSQSVAAQPLGFSAGRTAANERIANIRKDETDKVIVSLENFLLEVGEDSWVDLGILILDDPINQVKLSCYTQPTPVDVRFVDLAKEKTPEDYPQRWSGLKEPIGGIIADKLGVLKNQWHEAVTGGTSRQDIVYFAANTLAGMYRKALTEKLEISSS